MLHGYLAEIRMDRRPMFEEFMKTIGAYSVKREEFVRSGQYWIRLDIRYDDTEEHGPKTREIFKTICSLD